MQGYVTCVGYTIMQMDTPKNGAAGARAAADWSADYIMYRLREAGISLRAIAAQHGLADGSGLSVAMRRSFPAGERRIAQALGVEPRAIWPSRYHADGTPRPRGEHARQLRRAA